jgi:hypothetical protein
MPAETKPESETLTKHSKKPDKFQKLLLSLWATKKRRIITISVAVVVILTMLLAIPYTRYAIAGTVVKKSATIVVNDSVSNKPISEVAVMLAGQTVKTNAKGEAKFVSIPVGDHQLKIEKKYYHIQQQSFRVPILTGVSNAKFAIKATGRTVSVKIVNKVSGAVLENAKVSVSDTTAVTDKNGEASIVLPIRSIAQKAKVEAEGYNATEIELKVTNAENQKYDAALMPAGKIYYLSKRTGKINVVKSNLDGSDQQVVLEGTGRENDYQTALLASRDWKYLALLTRREGDKPKLYLINTSTNKLSVMDEGDAEFQLTGWSGHYFVYSLTRKKQNYWDDKKQALKSFNAESGQLRTLDETAGGGMNQWSYAYESFRGIYILKDRILYTKDWQFPYYYYIQETGRKSAITSIKPNGESKQSLKEFVETPNVHISDRLYAPDEVYFAVDDNGTKTTFFEYENGKVTDTDIDNEKFYNGPYSTYLISPSDSKSFWSESRDGKNALIIGGANAEDGKEITTLSDEFVPYGWFSDDYLLLSKKGSELYILSRVNPKNGPVKISDYHRPGLSYPGYGRGYGGS